MIRTNEPDSQIGRTVTKVSASVAVSIAQRSNERKEKMRIIAKRILESFFVAIAIGFSAIASAQSLPVVRFHEYGPNIVHLPTWVMAEKNLCTPYGIKCEAIQLNTAVLAQSAAAAGSLDFVLSTADVALQAIANGNDLQFTAGYMNGNPYTFVVRSGFPLPHKAEGFPNVLQDFNGKNIGVIARGGSAEIILKILLKEAKISDSNVSFIALGPPANAFAALAAKQVDAALSWDPITALCGASGACYSLIDLRKGEGSKDLKSIDTISIYLYSPRKFVQTNPERIRAFNKALTDAVKWIKDPKNSKEVMEIVKKKITFGANIQDPEGAYKIMVSELIPRLTSPHIATPADELRGVEAWYQFMIKNEAIKTSLDINALMFRENK